MGSAIPVRQRRSRIGRGDDERKTPTHGYTSIDIYWVIDMFLLLLIGVGPKIALVPFLEITASLDGKTKAIIVRKMITTAGVVSLLLVGLGELAGPTASLLDWITLGRRRPHPGHHRHDDGARYSRTKGQSGHKGT